MTIQTVASLKEFFRDALHDALSHQHVAVEDQTEHYVVNLLTLFSDADALYGPTSTAISPGRSGCFSASAVGRLICSSVYLE